MSQELVPIGQEVSAVLQVIERAASNREVDVSKLEKLLDMQERILNRNAEMAFNSAMTQMQAELPTIAKSGEIRVNGQIRSHYRKFEDINQAIKPILQKHGFAITFRTDTEGNQVKVTAKLTHNQGHSESTSMTLPADDSGAKNNVQKIGSSVQYGKRYVMEALLNITSEGTDDDGNGGTKGMPETVKVDFLAAIDELATRPDADALWKKISDACAGSGDVAAYEELRGKIVAKRKGLQ